MDLLPQRPQPPRSVAAACRDWLRWFGIGRLLAGAFAVAAVGAGAFWLMRAPRPPVEDSLPIAVRSSTTVAAAPPTTSAGATSTSVATVIVVDVEGAVVAPGVYELPAGARIDDAIDAAGGVSAAADPSTVNLATVLHDGDRVYVPQVGVPVPTVSAPTNVTSPSSVLGPAGPVDLNRATVAELDALPGIGPSTAAAIITHRDQSGPFGSVDDLLTVRGIGPAKLEAIRSLVTV